ncbi:MAG: biotin carboxylase [Crocinitomicaceae bacterium]|nr:biotin carboxylase [Crocinitomicaceae bacterium]|tara:strand:+ start:7625 stop:8671 length:1047 start_codon:yes stop_codon:yes gene_type:complete
MKPLTIAVTGLNNNDNPGPGISITRALKASTLEVKVIGLSYEYSEPGIYLEHQLAIYMIPYPIPGSDNVFRRLKEINDLHKIDMLIPNFDTEIANFIRLQPKLSEIGIKMILPTLEQFNERRKEKLSEFGTKYKLDVPSSEPISSVDKIHSFASINGYPLVVKGKFYEAEVVWNYEHATKAFNKISSKWGLPIVLQKYVDGIELNVCALGDGTGNTFGTVLMRKLYVTEIGKAWSGMVIADSDLEKITKKLINKTKWNGPMELEVIKSKDDGSYQILEINPRFPAWVYLSVGAGINLPERMVKKCFKKPIKNNIKAKEGTMFIRYSIDLICTNERFEKILSLDGNILP